MKSKLAMIIDSSKCFHCKACLVACQVENQVPVGFSRNWVKVSPLDSTDGMHFQPGNCMHCDKPACVEACPTGATYKDSSDGVVKVREDLCIGCGSCIPSCPYGARYRHPIKKIVDKCDYCASRRERGKLPACVETCPTQARVFGDLNDVNSPVARLLETKKTVRVVNNETDTEPAIFYVNQTAPRDWPVKAEAPLPIQLWRQVAVPLVKGVTGLTGLGVLLMLGRQLITGDEPLGHDTHDEAKDTGINDNEQKE
jgi:Fe-S-cluster-containing dehydrogenase component